MQTLVTAALAVISLTCLAQAHMQMSDPPPLLSKWNKYTTSQDYDMTSPLHADGSNFPCKGHLNVLGTSQAQPVAQWTPGQSYSITLTGGASHNGGSCQVSLSLDDGKSWKAIHSYVGNCPITGDSQFEFTLPGDTPSGSMLFAWTWFNKVGNREMYMNCAVINVLGGMSRKRRGTAKSIASRPDMFVANVGNGCGTSEGKDVMFPDPGPDVDMDSTGTAPPTGNCNAASSGPPSGDAAEAPSPAAPQPSEEPEDDVPQQSSAQPDPPAVAQPPNAPLRFTNDTMPAYGGQNSTMAAAPASPPADDAPAPPRTTEPAEPAPTSGPAPGSQCMPGSYQCATSPSSGGQGWEVCDVSGTWMVSLLSDPRSREPY